MDLRLWGEELQFERDGGVPKLDVAREFELKTSEIQRLVDESEAGIENTFRVNPRDVAEIYEKKIYELTSACGEAMLELNARITVSCYLGDDED